MLTVYNPRTKTNRPLPRPRIPKPEVPHTNSFEVTLAWQPCSLAPNLKTNSSVTEADSSCRFRSCLARFQLGASTYCSRRAALVLMHVHELSRTIRTWSSLGATHA